MNHGSIDRIRRLRFGISTLMLGMAASAICISYTSTFARSKLLEQLPYSDELLSRNLANGRTVIVTLHARWDPESKFCELNALNGRRASQLIREWRPALLRADANDPSWDMLRSLYGIGSTPSPNKTYPQFLLQRSELI